MSNFCLFLLIIIQKYWRWLRSDEGKKQKTKQTKQNEKKNVPGAKYYLYDKSSYLDFPWLLFEFLLTKNYEIIIHSANWKNLPRVKWFMLVMVDYTMTLKMVNKTKNSGSERVAGLIMPLIVPRTRSLLDCTVHRWDLIVVISESK